MATLEQIIDEARALSPREKGKLRQALTRELERPAPVQSAKPAYPTNEKERAWIVAHRDEYLGQWVALDGDLLVARTVRTRKRFTMKPEGKASRHLILLTSCQRSRLMSGDGEPKCIYSNRDRC